MAWHSHPRKEDKDPESQKMNDGPGGPNRFNRGFSLPDIDFNRNKKDQNGFGGPIKGGLCGSDGSVRVHDPNKVTNATADGYSHSKDKNNPYNPRQDPDGGEYWAPGTVIGKWTP